MDILYVPLIVFTLIILLYVTYQDIKYREINVISLLILAVVSVVYLGIFIFKNNSFLWYNYVLQLIITFLFLFIFYLLGKLSNLTYIGEGDLYIILGISFTNIFDIYFSMFIFISALFLNLLIPIGIFLFNLLSKNYPKHSFLKSIYLMFLGYPLKLNKITNFYTPLEKYVLEEGILKYKTTIKPNIEPEKELKLLKSFAKKNNISQIWVSPLVPFAILIFLGYVLVISLYLLDIINYLLSFFI